MVVGFLGKIREEGAGFKSKKVVPNFEILHERMREEVATLHSCHGEDWK